VFPALLRPVYISDEIRQHSSWRFPRSLRVGGSCCWDSKKLYHVAPTIYPRTRNSGQHSRASCSSTTMVALIWWLLGGVLTSMRAQRASPRLHVVFETYGVTASVVVRTPSTSPNSDCCSQSLFRLFIPPMQRIVLSFFTAARFSVFRHPQQLVFTNTRCRKKAWERMA
jgi:hypothetical protein